MRALLLDIGGVVLRSGHEMMACLGARRPELASLTDRRGRLGMTPDLHWERVLTGTASERGYWAERAAEYGALTGGDARTSTFMAALYEEGGEVVRPEADALVADARAAGVVVGALSNDFAAFHGDAEVTRCPAFGLLDPLVDGSVTGVLKPDPQAYRIALEALGLAAGDVVFVDDMPGNVEGGREAGLITVWVDVERPDAAFERVRELLGMARRAT